MKKLLVGFVGSLILTVMMVFAEVPNGDFDDPDWSGPDSVFGDPDTLCVKLTDAGTEPGNGAPPVPNGQGKVLCIDNRNKQPQRPIRVTFLFTCPMGNGTCQLKYDFSGVNVTFGGGGVDVFVDDDGTFSNPDDMWAPVGLPPQSTFGSNTEGAGSCNPANQHKVDFVVKPGTLWYIDNLRTECLQTVPVESSTWGRLKELYR